MINNLKNLKKSIFGLFALVMVFGLVFTLSAFKLKTQPELYWYKISATNTLEEQLNEFKVDKDEAMNGAEPLTDCPDSGDDYCIIGYETEQTINDPAPSPATNDHVVRYTR